MVVAKSIRGCSGWWSRRTSGGAQDGGREEPPGELQECSGLWSRRTSGWVIVQKKNLRLSSGPLRELVRCWQNPTTPGVAGHIKRRGRGGSTCHSPFWEFHGHSREIFHEREKRFDWAAAAPGIAGFSGYTRTKPEFSFSCEYGATGYFEVLIIRVNHCHLLVMEHHS